MSQLSIQTPDLSSILRRHLMSELNRHSEHGKTPSLHSPPASLESPPLSPPTPRTPTFFRFIASLLYSVVPCAALFSSYCILMDPLWLKLFRSLWFFSLVRLIVLPLAPNSAHSSKCLIWTILSVARPHQHTTSIPLFSLSLPRPLRRRLLLLFLLLFSSFRSHRQSAPPPPHTLSLWQCLHFHIKDVSWHGRLKSTIFPKPLWMQRRFAQLNQNRMKEEKKKDDGGEEEEGNRLCQHELKK